MSPGAWSGVRFAAINLRCARNMPVPTPQQAGGLTLRTVDPEELGRFEELNAELRPGKRFSDWRRWTFRRVGTKLLWVAETADGEFVGLNMYYFREPEWRSRVVHEAFYGVVPDYRRRGISDSMRDAAAAHFRDSGIEGISAEIERDNTPSWRASERRGYRVVGSPLSEKPLLIRPLNVGSRPGSDLS